MFSSGRRSSISSHRVKRTLEPTALGSALQTKIRSISPTLSATRVSSAPLSLPLSLTLPITEQCQRLTIKAGQTLLLPGGWIHAVYTPLDSLVYGGNFLLSPGLLRQLQVHQLETSARVPRKYLFPYYKQMLWYAACCSLQQHRHDTNPQVLPPFPLSLSLIAIVS
jgi:hypothetical protein